MWMPPVYVDLECVSLLCFDVREIGAELRVLVYKESSFKMLLKRAQLGN